jgi:hypothetical protein
MFVSSNANQLIRIMTMIGDFGNPYSKSFLETTPRLIDIDFIKFDSLPSIVNSFQDLPASS